MKSLRAYLIVKRLIISRIIIVFQPDVLRSSCLKFLIRHPVTSKANNWIPAQHTAGMTEHENCAQGGFTLIELLIATALLSIILSAIYGAFFLSHKAMAGLDESLVKLQECRTALDVMGRETESLLYRPGNSYSLFKIEDKDFYGKSASRLTFTAFSPLSPGISLISYYVEEKDGGLTLFKKMDNVYRTVTAKGTELIEGIESFTVEVKDGNRWVRTWNTAETGRPPAEVRITIVSRIKDKPVSFFDTVRPKIGGAI